MKFRKILCIGIVICTLFTLTACTGNMQTAKWEGYTDLSFMDFLEQGIYGNIIEEDVDVSVEINCESGWDNATKLDETDVSFGTKPVTYIISAYNSAYTEKGFEESSAEVYIFMELNTMKNTLSIMGGATEEEGYINHLKASETKEFLNQLKRYID